MDDFWAVGTLLTVKGRIITTRYGSNIAESDNGKEEKLLRYRTSIGVLIQLRKNNLTVTRLRSVIPGP